MQRSFYMMTFVVLLSVSDSPSATDRVDGTDDSGKDYVTSMQDYTIPAVELTNQHGDRVEIQDLITVERPVIVQFIFTSCKTICPMLTSTLAQAQDRIRRIKRGTKIVSISIDPEFDTPRRLLEYSSSHNAGGDWLFLTGSRETVRTVLGAFDARYEGENKMNHRPYTFMKGPNSPMWLRIDGLASASQIVEEWTNLNAAGNEEFEAGGETR